MFKFRSVLATIVILLVATAAQGARLNLPLPHYPYVSSAFIDIDFVPSAGGTDGTLTAYGYTAQLRTDATTTSDLFGEFSLTAQIDAEGIASSGSLSLTSDFADSIMYNSTDLTGFGFGGDEDMMEFTFTQDGATSMVPDDAMLCVILYGIGMPGSQYDFTTSWDNYDGTPGNGNGHSETFYAPEPATMILLAAGSLGLLRRRRK